MVTVCPIVEKSPIVVPVHLAIIAGHDPVMLYVDNLLCACDDIAISASCSSFNSCMITLSPYGVPSFHAI